MTIQCDEITCQRVGTLAAYGWTDAAIADALLLTLDQIAWAKTTDQFRGNFTRYSAERMEKAVTVAEGWDHLEEKSIERIAQALEYNVDPRFALQVARVANQAHRRTEGRGDRVIDASKSDAPKVIQLSMNVNFISQKTNGENATLDITARQPGVLPRRQADVPTPQAVSNLLAPAREKLKIKEAEFLEGLDFKMAENE